MKKPARLAILLLALCTALSACSSPQQETQPDAATPSAGPAQAGSANGYDPSQEDGEIGPYDPGTDAVGIEFVVDEFNTDHLPAGSITVHEARQIIVDTLHPEDDFTVPEGYTLRYRCTGLTEIEGELFYCIDFETLGQFDVNIERAFAVSMTGALYEGVPGTDAYTTYEMYAAHRDERGGDTSEEGAMALVQYAMDSAGITSPLIWRTGEAVIENEYCMTFAAGDKSADGEKYTAMHQFAVSDSGMLWYMDVVEGSDWLPFFDDAN